MSVAAVYCGPSVSPEEFLASESTSGRKREYVDGMVYLREGSTVGHCTIVANIIGTLHPLLRKQRHRIFDSNMLVRVENAKDLRFYYPDAAIYCGPPNPEARMIENPAVVFEVLSESTARIDTGEKRIAYLTIATLEAYVLVDSECRAVTVWRQKDGKWGPEVLTASDAVLEFALASVALSVAEIYEGTGL